MKIKKDAGKANIKEMGKAKENVKTPISECQAENPLECKYHGIQHLQGMLKDIVPSGVGYNCDKLQNGNGYEVFLNGFNGSDDEGNAIADKLAMVFKDNGYHASFKSAEGEGLPTITISKNKIAETVESSDDEVDDIDSADGDEGEDTLSDDEIANFIMEDDLSDDEDTKEEETFSDDELDGVLESLEQEELDEENKPMLTLGDVVEKWNNICSDGQQKGLFTVQDADFKQVLKPFHKAMLQQDVYAASKQVEELQKFYDKKIAENGGSSEGSAANGKEQLEKTFNEMMESANEAKSLFGLNDKDLNVFSKDFTDAIKAGENDKALGVMTDFGKYLQNKKKEVDLENAVKEASSIVQKVKDSGLILSIDKNKINSLLDVFNDAYAEMDLEATTKALSSIKDFVTAAEMKGEEPTEAEKLQAEYSAFKNSVPANISNDGHTIDFGMTKLKQDMEKNIEESIAKDDLDQAKKMFESYKGLVNSSAASANDKKVDKTYASIKKNIWDMLAAHKNQFGPQQTAPIMDELNAAKKNGDIAGMEAAYEKMVELVEPAKAKKNSAKQNGNISGSENAVSAELLKPLEHDENKFPKNLTQKQIEDALSEGEDANGHGGLGTKIITIGDKKYVCKVGAGLPAQVIRNGYAADMAYRAGGIYAPDAKLYEFGDGKTYKLSEFIKGQRLIDVFKNATDEERDGLSKELLKGYPLDVLFSNYDVLGTSPDPDVVQIVKVRDNSGKMVSRKLAYDNIIIGDDGHAYRIDNDGSFAFTGKGAHKVSNKVNFATPCVSEEWKEWNKRKWIDDFRTMRCNERNAGIFERYSTADIFLSAGNIDLSRAVSSLPETLQKAIAKPLFEMKQMTMRAVSAELSGIKNNEMLSIALDASYEASKKGLREKCREEISYSYGGYGSKKDDGTIKIPPFTKPEPLPPVDPSEKFDSNHTLQNSEYHGDIVSKIILNAAKTINHHAGYQQKDENGKVLGNGTAMSTPDYKPNHTHIDAFNKLNRDKIAELAKTDPNAAILLKNYDSVSVSMANGFKTPVEQVKALTIGGFLPAGFKTKEEIAFEKDNEGAINQYKKDLAEYTKKHEEWVKENNAFEAAEKAKLKKDPYVNFNGFADAVIKENRTTNGVAQNNGLGVDLIEDGKESNKFGGHYNAETKECSWTPPASKLKVLELVMRGMSLNQIANIGDNDPFINNGHWSSKKAKNWFIGEAKNYIKDKNAFAKDLRTFAMWKGMQTLKLENEDSPSSLGNGEKINLIRHKGHTVGLARADQYLGKGIGKVGEVQQKGSCTSCGFQSNGCLAGSQSFVYDVPLWNVAYSYADLNKPKSKFDDFQGSEHEWVATLIGLTPFEVDRNENAILNQKKAMENSQMMKEHKAREDRMAPFFTTFDELNKFSLAS